MSSSVQLTNFTDFDRMLGGKNFLVTILGAAAAFILGYLQIFVSIPLIPYNLTFIVALMILVSVYTANIASSTFVVLVGAMGLRSPDGGLPDFFLGFLFVNLLICLSLGYFANRLRLIMRWTRFNHFFIVFFAIFSIILGYLFQLETSNYTDNGVDVATGGDLGLGLGIPVLDIAVFGVILILVMISAFALKGQVQLTTSSSKKYIYLGYFLIALGYISTIVPFFLFTIDLAPETLELIADTNYNISILSEIFFYGNDYGVLGTIANIFFIMPISVALILIGVNLKTVGEHRGNLEGIRGGSDISYYAAPIAIIFYFVYSSFIIQDFLHEGGAFIAGELFPIFAAVIWSIYIINQIIARIVLFILDLI